MISFMVIAQPRSGTTWAANWLTTGTSLCLHDPLWNYHYSQLDEIKSEKTLGISCTGIGYWPDWLNQHPARKVVLHRSEAEVEESLLKLSIECWPIKMDLHAINGLHCQWTDIFDNPKPIYEYLLQMPFDEIRHAELKEMNIQPALNKLRFNSELLGRLKEELCVA